MTFTPKQRVLATLLGGKVDQTPVTSIAGCGGTVCVDAQKATGLYFPEAHKDPEKMAQLARASHDLTGLESVRVPFDFVVEPEALGCQIQWYAGIDSVPTVLHPPSTDPEELRKPVNLLEKGRIPVVLDAIRLVRKAVGDFLPISSLALGPFTLLGNLVGVGNLLRWVVTKPDWIKKYITFATDVTVEYAKAQYRSGSDIVEVGDPMASEDMINVEMFQEFVKPALTEIADRLHGMRVLHICGRTANLLPDLSEIGFNGVSVEEGVDIASIKPLVGDVKILGNVSSKNTLVFGSPEDVKDEARRALMAGVDLLEPSCGIAPITPLKNIKAMTAARNEFFA